MSARPLGSIQMKKNKKRNRKIFFVMLILCDKTKQCNSPYCLICVVGTKSNDSIRITILRSKVPYLVLGI